MAFAVANQPFGSTPKVDATNVVIAAADNFESLIIAIHTCCHVCVGGQMVPLNITIATTIVQKRRLFINYLAHIKSRECIVDSLQWLYWLYYLILIVVEGVDSQ
jgi:hypothetical protein